MRIKSALSLVAAVALALAWTALIWYALPARASTTTLTGTIKDAQGNGVNGTLVMQLPAGASDGATAIAPTPVVFNLVNGTISGGAALYDVATLQPTNLYYTARAYNTAGQLVFAGNYVVTGASFNLGAATPTSVTTSNVSYLSPAGLATNNAFTGNNTHTGTETFGNLNKTYVLDGVEFTTLSGIQANACPASGCTVLIPNGATLDASAVAITKPIHFIFDAGSFAFAGFTCTTGTEGVRISGANRGGTSTTQGTVLTVASTSLIANNMTNCPGIEFDHISIVGPGSGTGKGIYIGGTRTKLDHVLVTAFGSDGITIDGGTVNSNNAACIGSRSSNNGGHGWKLLGTNANLATFVACDGSGNTGDGINSANTVIFDGMNTDANNGFGYHFVSGGQGFGTIFANETSNAVKFESGANGSYLIMTSNNMVVTDSGSGNQYFNGAAAANSWPRVLTNTLALFPSVTFATLPASGNGTVIFCSDCNATCTAGSSTGRTCFRENGAWTH